MYHHASGDPRALPVSTQVTMGVKLSVVDFLEMQRSARSDATTHATVDFGAPEPGYLWRVERIVATCPPDNGLDSVRVYVFAGDQLPINTKDYTLLTPETEEFDKWRVDIAEYPSFLTVPSSQNLQVLFVGAVVGDVCSASVQYQLVQKAVGG
jgi:hypothetical protein